MASGNPTPRGAPGSEAPPQVPPVPGAVPPTGAAPSGASPPPAPGNPGARRQAAALRYDPGQPAPVVVAAGQGVVAENIIATAQAAGVPVRSAPDLAAALVALGVGAQVPPALYAAVAEVLAWVAQVDAARAQRWTAGARAAAPAAPPGPGQSPQHPGGDPPPAGR